ncbi:hypothetical protein ABW20_dc0106263 [Dactylellina cionopaga]|nr:hypothetical protein ABW20_dc0106263 [Dactylellina cionopaga]
MTGVLLAQISVIVFKEEQLSQETGMPQNPIENSSHDPFASMPPIHRAAKTLSACTVGIGLATIAIGVFRFYYGQKALIEGFGVSGGWPIIGLAIVVLCYLIIVFILAVISSDPE